MKESKVHSNALRSHTQFPIKDERKVAIGLIGKDALEETETTLMETILDRVPKDDETERKFDIRWVLSCYVVYSQVKPVKEPETPKKIPKSNGKDKAEKVDLKKETKKAIKRVEEGKKVDVPSDVLMQGYEKGNAIDVNTVDVGAGVVNDTVKKVLKKGGMPGSMDIKTDRPTSTKLINSNSLDSAKNVVAEVL